MHWDTGVASSRLCGRPPRTGAHRGAARQHRFEFLRGSLSCGSRRDRGPGHRFRLRPADRPPVRPRAGRAGGRFLWRGCGPRPACGSPRSFVERGRFLSQLAPTSIITLEWRFGMLSQTFSGQTSGAWRPNREQGRNDSRSNWVGSGIYRGPRRAGHRPRQHGGPCRPTPDRRCDEAGGRKPGRSRIRSRYTSSIRTRAGATGVWRTGSTSRTCSGASRRANGRSTRSGGCPSPTRLRASWDTRSRSAVTEWRLPGRAMLKRSSE
jgi:hypothetical protein